VPVPRYAYFQGRIVPYSEAKVGVMNHTLNYGTGAFAGVRGYWNPEQEQLFISVCSITCNACCVRRA